MPFEPTTRAQQIGQSLGGFSAGLQGTLPQFQQAQLQKQQFQAQGQQRQQEQSQARQQAVFQDAQAGLQLLDEGNYDGLVTLGMNRLQSLSQLGAEDPTDTQRLTQLALAARNGNEEAEDLLRAELSSTVSLGRATGALQDPDIPKGASDVGKIEQDLAAGLIDQEQADAAIARLDPEEAGKARRVLQDAQGVSRFVDTGEPVFPDDAAAVGDRETQTDINGRQRFVDTGELVFPDVEAEVEIKEPSTAERGVAAFAKRTTDSGALISELGSMFTSTSSRAAGLVPRGAQSAERQQFDQAVEDFINATLRRESGAAIADSEFENARTQYIPQPGDGEEVLAQKQRNRETISASLRLEAGGAFTELEAELGGIDLEPETTATNAEGQTIFLRDGVWVDDQGNPV